MRAESDATNRGFPSVGGRRFTINQSQRETEDSFFLNDEFRALNNSYELNRHNVLYQYSSY